MKTYSVTSETFKILGDPKPTSTDEWLQCLSEEELKRWLEVFDRLTKNKESKEDGAKALNVIIALYTIELDVETLAITEELCQKLLARLHANLSLEKGRRKGFYIISDPLYLYKIEGRVELTPKGKEAVKRLKKRLRNKEE